MVLFYLRKLLHTLFSIILALSITALVITSLFVGFFSSESYVKKHIDNNKTEIISAIDGEVSKLSDETGLDKDAFVGAVNSSNFDVISSVVAKDLKYCYTVDFSGNTELYNIYSASISNPDKNGGKELKSNEVSKYASLAVATACKAINATDTANVKIFTSMQNNFYIVVIIASIVLIIVSVVFLEIANKGRHRKYSFIGMGIIMSGYLLVAGTYFVGKMDYVNKNVFLAFEPYNKALQQGVNEMLGKNYIIGIILFAAGLLMLALNYNYFRKKNIVTQREREFNKRLVTDFLEYDEKPASHHEAGTPFDTEVSKIDFEKQQEKEKEEK